MERHILYLPALNEGFKKGEKGCIVNNKTRGGEIAMRERERESFARMHSPCCIHTLAAQTDERTRGVDRRYPN